MLEHDELMRQAVAGLRARRSPELGAEARVFTALEQRWVDPSGGPDSSGTDAGSSGSAGPGEAAATGGSSTAATAGWVAKVIAATVGLTAGGLLLVSVGVGVLAPVSGVDEASREQAAATVEVQSEGVIPTQQPELPASEELPPIHVHAGARAERARAKRPPAVEPSALEPSASPDPLAAELALISAAKRASSPSAALELLDQHARDYPSGTMVSEREALAVVALCQLDHQDEARDRARRLVSQRPGLPVLHRVGRECPALTDLLRQTTP